MAEVILGDYLIPSYLSFIDGKFIWEIVFSILMQARMSR